MDEEERNRKPSKLLSLVEERQGRYSQPLLTKNHNVIITPPVLLPGETLILQQDKVTCVNTLWRAATGALHLTNYRIIFTGEFMQKFNSSILVMDDNRLSKLGYRYQEKKTMLQHVSNSIRERLPGKSKSLKVLRKSKNDEVKWTSNKLLPRHSLTPDSIHVINNESSPKNFRKNARNKFTGDNEVIITLPILSLLDIRKFPKQHLGTEKLQMLNDGIEIITTNFLSVKLCLGEEQSYDADELLLRLLKHTKVKSSNIFAYVHKGNIPSSFKTVEERNTSNVYTLDRECERLGMDTLTDWKKSEQCTCPSYPKQVFLPKMAVNNEDALGKWSKYYQDNCYPLLVWRNAQSKALLLRSSVSLMSRGNKDNRCIVDEDIIKSVSNECPNLRKLIIYTDSKTALCINGSFFKVKEPLFYPNCELEIWDNLPDILATQQSATRLYQVLEKSDDLQYMKCVEETGYLQELNFLLDYALCVVNTLNFNHVLLSIGSGVERAAQLSSLVQLIMDPFYRTMDGFQILLQKEWCSIAFPFKKRNLVDFSSEEDLSPLFLQFLDCVWQLTQQYPLSFEFSESLLEMLAEHSYSGRFGTFLNEEKETDENTPGSTLSIWSYIQLKISVSDHLLNYNYDQHHNRGVLQPRIGIPHLQIWSWFNRYRRDKTLYVSSMLETMELEKLQKEYQELLEKHTSLLSSLSDIDAASNVSSFNSRLCHSPDLISKDSPDSPQFGLFNEALGNKAQSIENLIAVDSESLHSDEFDIIDPIPKTEITKCGQSSFYSAVKEDSMCAMDLLKELKKEELPQDWKSTERFHSLDDYLISEGIQSSDVKEVEISKMMCSGYLTKKGANYRTWRRRWFQIDFNKKFVGYYEDETACSQSINPKGAFSYMGIQSVYVDDANNKNDKYTFILRTFDRTYYIRAPSEKAMNLWMTCFSIPVSCLAPT
eukprot:TCONS_00008846-protein